MSAMASQMDFSDILEAYQFTHRKAPGSGSQASGSSRSRSRKGLSRTSTLSLPDLAMPPSPPPEEDDDKEFRAWKTPTNIAGYGGHRPMEWKPRKKVVISLPVRDVPIDGPFRPWHTITNVCGYYGHRPKTWDPDVVLQRRLSAPTLPKPF
eukprot:TRINITY_DN48633_c0_g1_i1.p1 TRINITY_DN48633_c0_g1~~TRINITY_DN48633_c0_g1_i1.p1  ORF type:complete len:151 (-),score=23.43 TRINITY_DN48633_c0_g1_i1:58-510(-)